MARGDSELRPSVQCCHWANTAAGPSVRPLVRHCWHTVAGAVSLDEGREGEVALLLFTAQPSAAPLLSLLRLHVLHAVTSLIAVVGGAVCHFLRTVPLPLSSSASSPASAERAARAIRLAAPLNVEQVRMRAAISCTICSKGQRPQSGLFVVIIRT